MVIYALYDFDLNDKIWYNIYDRALPSCTIPRKGRKMTGFGNFCKMVLVAFAIAIIGATLFSGCSQVVSGVSTQVPAQAEATATYEVVGFVEFYKTGAAYPSRHQLVYAAKHNQFNFQEGDDFAVVTISGGVGLPETIVVQNGQDLARRFDVISNNNSHLRGSFSVK